MDVASCFELLDADTLTSVLVHIGQYVDPQAKYQYAITRNMNPFAFRWHRYRYIRVYRPFFRPQTTRPAASGSVPISAFAGSGGVTDVTDVIFHVLLA